MLLVPAQPQEQSGLKTVSLLPSMVTVLEAVSASLLLSKELFLLGLAAPAGRPVGPCQPYMAAQSLPGAGAPLWLSSDLRVL